MKNAIKKIATLLTLSTIPFMSISKANDKESKSWRDIAPTYNLTDNKSKIRKKLIYFKWFSSKLNFLLNFVFINSFTLN